MLRGGVKLEKALAKRRAELDARVIEPVTVAWGEGKPRVALKGIDRASYRLTLEDGEKLEGKIEKGRLDRAVPFGYHKLRVDKKHETMLFVAPMKAPEPQGRAWGIFAPLYAMHTDVTWGVGDLGDMREYQQWLSTIGGSVVATLPLNAAFVEDDPSPYSPISRLFWNEMYLEIPRLPEYRGEALPPMTHTDRVDYRQVMAAKRRVLVDLAQRFFDNPEPGFDEFAKGANDYALFRSRMESTRGLWLDWADEDVFSFEAVRYHLYVQYRMEQQLGELEGLYLDFPLGVHPNGYDAWRFDDQFAKKVAVGSPPDLYFTKGQNWGFPPLHPDAIRSAGHGYFRECLRRQLAHASVLRIDHVMALHRLFWIPEGLEAADGVYVRYPDDELYAVLTIEANRSGSVIVGEDLGTVPQYVPKAMDKHGIRRMYVVQYEIKPQGANPIGKPPVDSAASINTHDMPTFAGFWSGLDIDDRLEQQLLDENGAEEERSRRERMRRSLIKFLKACHLLDVDVSDARTIFEPLLRFVSRSDAEMVLVNLEDLWLENEPQNVPGVPDRSWRRRLRLSLQEMQSDDTVMRLLQTVDAARRKNDGDEK